MNFEKKGWVALTVPIFYLLVALVLPNLEAEARQPRRSRLRSSYQEAAECRPDLGVSDDQNRTSEILS